MTLDLHFDSWLGDILKKGHKPQMFVFFKNIFDTFWYFVTKYSRLSPCGYLAIMDTQ